MASIPLRDSGDAGFGDEPPEALPATALVEGLFNTAAVLVSLALVGGLAVWGYRLAVRDVAGVPVIRALEGPARIAPADPGGELARHVGLSVTAVAASGTARAMPEQVVLAPRPIELEATDAPMAALAPLAAGTAPAPAAVAPAAATAAPQLDRFAALPEAGAPGLPLAPGEEPDAVILALAEAMAYGAALTPAAHAGPLGSGTAVAATARADLVPESVPGVVRSPKPAARPARLLLASAASALDLAPEALVPGMRLVQLGAFASPELARAEWDRVAARFEALIAGKQRVIQSAESGGRVFYRLRVAGFGNADEARQFCAALAAEQTNCIPAQVF
ncbi:MAG: SPOR domain-containing protein [Phaeovulum sp.]|uniref:SPOR domain-containing protein n=1 Tax=Phaeovulum sp. TaxID=2934796 RepID=UPI002731D521|nr:SPOR domain-containing protein [Phaeovulum sp.]MDP2062695.1 SPOR domain-containing protein [Phaeovulum sp.]